MARIIIFLLTLAFAFVAARYRHWLVTNFGRIYYAEKYLGGAGSYTFWPLLGALVAFLGLLVLIGRIG